MITLSELTKVVKPSATLAAGAKARQLRAAGTTVFDFSLGEPDFDTPAHICDAADKAMRNGQTHYTPANGLAELRSAVTGFYKRLYDFDCAPEEVIISNGAKHSIHTALAATVGPGDEVIIPTPYWVSYSELVQMTGAQPVLVETTPAEPLCAAEGKATGSRSDETNFTMTPEQLDRHITERTKLLMLNSPSNPTGAVYTRAQLEALVDVILPHEKIAILSDEIYEQLTFGDAEPTCIVTLRPELRDRTLTVSGVSKTYAMTGWRIGWTVGPAHVVKAMNTIQGQQSGCPCSISQAAALAALEGPQDCVAEMREKFDERRKFVYDRLCEIPGLKVPKPEGAFYSFFDVSSYFGKKFGDTEVTDSLSFCTTLLESAHVNLVPGVAFGAEGFVRMSYAAAMDQLEEGLRLLRHFLTGE